MRKRKSGVRLCSPLQALCTVFLRLFRLKGFWGTALLPMEVFDTARNRCIGLEEYSVPLVPTEEELQKHTDIPGQGP